MREIKFRIWDGEKMIYESLQKEYDDYYMLNLQGEFFGHTRTGDEYFNYDTDEINKKHFELMQYTGLKDKNNKEICEGDILKSLDVLLTVFYNTATACFDTLFYGDESGDCEGLYNSVISDENIEIIGNIYQNPELLKK